MHDFVINSYLDIYNYVICHFLQTKTVVFNKTYLTAYVLQAFNKLKFSVYFFLMI